MKKIFVLITVCVCFLVFSVCAFAADDMRAYFDSVGAETGDLNDGETVTREKAARFLDVFANAAGRKNIIKDGGDITVGENEYISALLTVLGYSEEEGDFLSFLSFDKALELGIVETSDLESEGFTGDKVIKYSFRALAAKPKIGEALCENSIFAGAKYTELAVKHPTTALSAFPLVSLSGEIISDDFSAIAVRDFKFDVKVSCENTEHTIEIYRTADKYDGGLKKGSVFCGFSFVGEPVSVCVSSKTDTKTCEIFSEKSCDAVFENGKLKITVSEPQIIKVVFDNSNEITIGAGTTADQTAESAASGILPTEYTSISAINTAKNKIIIGKHAFYTENGVISVGGELFVDESVCAVLGKSGEELVKAEKYGVTYISVSDLGGSVDSGSGEIYFEPSRNRITDLVFASANENSSVAISQGFMSVTALSDGVASAMASVSDISYNESLMFTSDCSADAAVPTEFTIAAVRDDGSVCAVKHTVKCGGTKLPVQTYFDMTKIGKYDRLYIIVSFEKNKCDVISLRDYSLEAFTSPGYGDNEFDPFK